jgi:hypothetical protein
MRGLQSKYMMMGTLYIARDQAKLPAFSVVLGGTASHMQITCLDPYLAQAYVCRGAYFIAPPTGSTANCTNRTTYTLLRPSQVGVLTCLFV